MARKYRVCIAASNQLENECLERVRILLEDEELWAIMPRRAIREDKQCLGFRMLSKLGCAVTQLLIVPHEECQLQVF
eukprot:8753524-Pyramimonas_sp.AAC.1